MKKYFDTVEDDASIERNDELKNTTNGVTKNEIFNLFRDNTYYQYLEIIVNFEQLNRRKKHLSFVSN